MYWVFCGYQHAVVMVFVCTGAKSTTTNIFGLDIVLSLILLYAYCIARNFGEIFDLVISPIYLNAHAPMVESIQIAKF